MSFQFSCFISYRRDFGDSDFLRKFKDAIRTAGLKATNKEVFFDDNSIDWGKEFDEKICESIFTSYFFVPMYHYHYLSLDKMWCARELFLAIQFENKIRERIKDFCFILPIIDSGEASDMPNCIGSKNAKQIQRIKHIFSKKNSKAYIDFVEDVHLILLKNYKLIQGDISFYDVFKEMEYPDDNEIKAWIRKQKEIEKKNQASHLPILTKKIA